MEKKEAIKILIKQIRDYDDWADVILDSLSHKKEYCKHPYLCWIGKEQNQSILCLVCGKTLEEKEISKSFVTFDKHSLVKKAIDRLELELGSLQVKEE